MTPPVAPAEVLKQAYGQKCDVWSAGEEGRPVVEGVRGEPDARWLLQAWPTTPEGIGSWVPAAMWPRTPDGLRHWSISCSPALCTTRHGGVLLAVASMRILGEVHLPPSPHQV